MSDIGPGDWVEAIADSPPWGGLIGISNGAVYRVLSLVEGSPACESCGTTEPGVRLPGDRAHANASHCVCVLRPIYRPKADLIRDLQRPIRVKEDA